LADTCGVGSVHALDERVDHLGEARFTVIVEAKGDPPPVVLAPHGDELPVTDRP
jgi:hypothetical protein